MSRAIGLLASSASASGSPLKGSSSGRVAVMAAGYPDHRPGAHPRCCATLRRHPRPARGRAPDDRSAPADVSLHIINRSPFGMRRAVPDTMAGPSAPSSRRRPKGQPCLLVRHTLRPVSAGGATHSAVCAAPPRTGSSAAPTAALPSSSSTRPAAVPPARSAACSAPCAHSTTTPPGCAPTSIRERRQLIRDRPWTQFAG